MNTYIATWYNQYGRPIGYGNGQTSEEATAKASADATKELSSANPNWKWRRAKLRIKRL